MTAPPIQQQTPPVPQQTQPARPNRAPDRIICWLCWIVLCAFCLWFVLARRWPDIILRHVLSDAWDSSKVPESLMFVLVPIMVVLASVLLTRRRTEASIYALASMLIAGGAALTSLVLGRADAHVLVDSLTLGVVATLLLAVRVATTTPAPPPAAPASSTPTQAPTLPVTVLPNGARVCLSKLPVTSPVLFGRTKELATLTRACGDDHTHLVTIIAFGGIGKSALTNYWLRGMEKKGYNGARRVFGWSFYSQGTRDTAVSADQFINAALIFFGDPDPTAGSPWDKGERLAQLIRKERTLLILDGLEPLQSTNPGEEGKIKDPALDTLLRELRTGSNGLCVISSRMEVSDLHASDDSGPVRRVALDRLSPEAGRQLLKHHRIKGRDEELDAAVKEYEGHALALVLLIEYLAAFLDRDIARRDEVPLLDQETRQGRHAFRVMEAYDLAFKRDNRKAERAILRLLGLFDRPASADCLAALRKPPAVPGVTDALISLSEKDWRHAVRRLRDLRLLSRPEEGHDDGSLDAHPLAREYFGPALEAESPDGFRDAHGRLYQYLRDNGKPGPDTDQDTLGDITLLLQAVNHGCRAGQQASAFCEVYRPRIQRGESYFSIHRLGAIAADLAALSGFFEKAWYRPHQSLDLTAQSIVLSTAGFDLLCLGMLSEATMTVEHALSLDEAAEDWENAARAACNLADIALTTGQLCTAGSVGRQAWSFAVRSGASREQLLAATYVAAALHYQGRLSDSLQAFSPIAKVLSKTDANAASAGSRPGFRSTMYGALLLDLGEYLRVLEIAAQALSWYQNSQDKRTLHVGLCHLTLGRALHAAGVSSPPGQAEVLGGSGVAPVSPDSHFASADAALRAAGIKSSVPLALLARASFLRDIGDRDGALRDLHEALDLSERCGFRLHETDARLLAGHLALDPGSAGVSPASSGGPDLAAAQAALTRAQDLVKETGYHLRDADLLLLEGRLLGKQGHPDAARTKLQEAITVAKREEADGCIYQVAVDQAHRYLRELDGEKVVPLF